MREERKEVERLLGGLHVALGAKLDAMRQELRSRVTQVESDLTAKFEEIDALLNLIAIELARRGENPPPDDVNHGR